MNVQMTSATVQNDEVTIEDRKNDVFTITPEMLSIVGGGEGMICIH